MSWRLEVHLTRATKSGEKMSVGFYTFTFVCLKTLFRANFSHLCFMQISCYLYNIVESDYSLKQIYPNLLTQFEKRPIF